MHLEGYTKCQLIFAETRALGGLYKIQNDGFRTIDN